MRKLLLMALAVILSISVSACDPDESPPLTEVPEQPGNNGNNGGENNPENEKENESMKLMIKIGSATFTATLTDNGTAKAFKAMLPMTINMVEHAGNEKYYDLPGNLPTAAINPGTIRNGDIMLFGSRTLVLFYKTFSTSYSYTRIGLVDNPSGLEQALGAGNVTVIFEMTE